MPVSLKTPRVLLSDVKEEEEGEENDKEEENNQEVKEEEEEKKMKTQNTENKLHQNPNPNPNLNQNDIEKRILMRSDMKHLFEWYYPEGGWGLMVLFSSSLNALLSSGLSFTLIFPLSNQIIRHFPSVTQEDIGYLASFSLMITHVSSIFTISYAGSHSARPLALLGALTLVLGTLFTSFITQFHQFYFSFGLIIGIGSSMVVDSSSVLLSQYFKKNREVVEILFMGSPGLGIGLLTIFETYLLKIWHWRHVLHGLSACLLFSLFLGLLYRPATLYHPQRRALLHLKGLRKQKLLEVKSRLLSNKSSNLSFVLLIRSSFAKNPFLRLLFLIYSLGAFGVHSPKVLLIQETPLSRHEDRNSLLLCLFGLCSSLGTLLFGTLCIYFKNGRLIICFVTTFLSSFLHISLAFVSESFWALLSLSLASGLLSGGILISGKMLLLQNVSSRQFFHLWSLSQVIQGMSLFLGISLTNYMNNQVFERPFGYIFSGTCLLTSGFLLLILRSKISKAHFHSSTNRIRNSCLCQKQIPSSKVSRKITRSGDDNDDLIRELDDLLGNITSCGKVENHIEDEDKEENDEGLHLETSFNNERNLIKTQRTTIFSSEKLIA